jgi:hypothetical protein
MSFFDNMLQLNNSFLLIALIIIAIICIYLLYSNLTKSGETASLKNGLSVLVQQNKKRDEIINFLLERIENLEHNVVPTQIQAAKTETHNKDDIEDIFEMSNTTLAYTSAEEVDNILKSINTLNPVDAISSNKDVDGTDINGSFIGDPTHNEPEYQNSIETEINKVDENTNTVFTGLQGQCDATDLIPNECVPDVELELNVGSVVSTTESNDFSELESEFSGLLNDGNLHVEQSQVQMPHNEEDLVSALLDIDEESLAGDHEFDLNTVPKSKEKLNSQYTVKQLKGLARQLNLKSKGNKTELINRISEKLK